MSAASAACRALARAVMFRLLDYRAPLPHLHRGARAQPWNKKLPLISVVVPCFNHGRFVLEALRSLKRQTLQDFEVILIDDGSDDPHTLRLLALLACLTTVQVLRQVNAGPGAARNRGICQARGRYICCLDADDCLAATYLEKCAVILESDQGVRLAQGWIRFFGTKEGDHRTYDLNPGLLRFVNHLGVSAMFYREDWLRVGGFSEDRQLLYEDWDFWMRLAELGIRSKIIREPMLFYRKHRESRLIQANRSARFNKILLREKHPRLFGDAAWRKALVANYRRCPVEDAFCNLSHAQKYRMQVRDALLLYLRADSRVSLINADELSAWLGDRTLLVFMATPQKLPAWLESSAEEVYRLFELMDTAQFDAFHSNYLKTRVVTAQWELSPGTGNGLRCSTVSRVEVLR